MTAIFFMTPLILAIFGAVAVVHYRPSIEDLFRKEDE